MEYQVRLESRAEGKRLGRENKGEMGLWVPWGLALALFRGEWPCAFLLEPHCSWGLRTSIPPTLQVPRTHPQKVCIRFQDAAQDWIFLQRSASKITIYKGCFQGNSKDRGPSYVLTKSYLWHPLKHTYLWAVRTPRTSASLPQEGRNSQVSLSTSS